jgi:hypothetical protein
MAHFFFIDESGIDHIDSPYEVICGIAIKDDDLWRIVSQLKQFEELYLGTRYSGKEREIKGRKFLKTKVFKQASLFNDITDEERRVLARDCILQPENATPRHLAALSQAKLAYVKKLLELCAQFRTKIFAAISSEPLRETDDKDDGLLRRDYVYAFERMYYFLEDRNMDEQGIIVFDELEKAQSHILVSQIENYFKKTVNGRQRAGLIIPEPFFVHSDLTTGIQIADIIAYIISWGLRLKDMNKPARAELAEYVELIKPLRYRTTRKIGNWKNHQIWSVVFVK